ncbi:MAG: hypothetical protein ABGY96_20710 [bacterium]|nr:hypothetical protein [Gammaproteobacteria bacterium]HIL94988.1 hypothetical protein [Pseudomonadales bacterium]
MGRFKRRAHALLVFCILITLTVETNANDFSGYLKNYSVIQDEIDNDLFQFDRLYRMQNFGRFMFDAFKGNQVWQLHYEVGLDSNSQLQRVSDALTQEKQSYRLTDIPETIGPDDRKNIAPQNLDRINIQFQFAAGDLTIGRQAITFGSARVINPTDVFLPFDVRTLNTEYRIGIDAIRFQKPIGQLSEFDLGIVLGEDGKPDNSAAFLQLLTNVSTSDLQFTIMRFSEQNLAGAGIQSALGNFGFWFEAAYVSGENNYTRASIGLDYAFSSTVFGMIEYHYNGAGSRDPAEYTSQQFDVAYRAGGVFLLGRNYIMPFISWQISALLSVSMQSIVNLNDNSFFLNTNLDYGLSDNLYLGLGYYHFSGDDLIIGSRGLPELGSEYGSNPDSIFVNLKYYF